MKTTTIIKSGMMLGLVGLTTSIFAQTTETSSRFGKQGFRTWSVGAHAGITSLNNPFNGKVKDFQTAKEDLGYGAYIKKQIFPSMGIQAEFFRGNVAGRNQYTGTMNAAGDPNYNGANSYSTQVNWSGAVTAIYNVANISINNTDGVLIPYVKAGAGYMSSEATLNTGAASTNISEREDWFIPVGAGLKLAVAKGINLDFGYDVNFLTTGKFNGVNSDRDDRFAYGHAGIEVALGKKSDPQLQSYSALANLKYQTKEESDELRKALSTAEQNAQRDRDQYAKDMGDDDSDGVANKFDKCAGTTANTVVDGSGCPIKVQREIVRETKVVVTEADRKVVGDAIKNLEFDLGKSTIRAKSYDKLNRVAALLVEKDFSLKLAGHTDNSGSRELNLRLSKDRAESIKAYLVSQGVNASRVEATGYGPDQPISTNKTATGRQENRRVEFTLY